MACETFTILTLEVFVFFILMLWATPRLALFPQHRWGFNILGQLCFHYFLYIWRRRNKTAGRQAKTATP